MNPIDLDQENYVKACFTRYLIILIRQRYSQLWKQHCRQATNLAFDTCQTYRGIEQDWIDVVVMHIALEEIYDRWLTRTEKEVVKGTLQHTPQIRLAAQLGVSQASISRLYQSALNKLRYALCDDSMRR